MTAARRLSCVVIAAAIMLASHAARAYRPFDQTDADTAEFNTIELELGPARFTHGSGSTLFEPGGVFNYGFSPGWELVVDADAYITLGSDGSASYALTDVLVEHLLRAGSLQEQSGPSVAIELGPLMPTLPKLGDEAGWSTALIVSQRFGVGTIHVNAQIEYTRERQLEYTGGAILEGPDDWTVRPVGEAYVERQDGVDFNSVLLGAIWRYRDHLMFDAALRATSQQGVDAAEIRVGLTWVIET